MMLVEMRVDSIFITHQRCSLATFDTTGYWYADEDNSRLNSFSGSKCSGSILLIVFLHVFSVCHVHFGVCLCFIQMDTIRSAVSNGKFTDMIHPRLTSANLGCNNVTLSVDEAIKLGLPTVSMVSGGNSASLPNSSKVLTASNESNSVLGPVHMSIDDVGKKQKDYLSSLVTDAMEGMRDEIHMDIQQLQIAMVRQFFIFEVNVAYHCHGSCF